MLKQNEHHHDLLGVIPIPINEENSSDIYKQRYQHIIGPTSYCIICCAFHFCCYCSLWATRTYTDMLYQCFATEQSIQYHWHFKQCLAMIWQHWACHWWFSGEWEETVLTQMNTGTNRREQSWKPIQRLSW